MNSNVPPLEWLAIHGKTYEYDFHWWDSNDSLPWTVVQGGDHEGEQYFFDAGEKPEILGNCLIVGPHKVDGCSVCVVPHPFWFYGLLSDLECKEAQDHEFDG